MHQLTTQQRKLVYLAGIVVVLIPIIWLGMPASAPPGEATHVTEAGGALARMRVKHDLGESTLGKVDPSSAAMNLVLLGLRGVAANVLWQQAEDQKAMKDWARLRTTIDSIVLLQPHYRHVWEFQGWNLAWNVSSTWDDVADRYYWVKEGGKFLMKGSEPNSKYAELPWNVGRTTGWKIGRSDEWQFYRNYWREDPDEDLWRVRPDGTRVPQGDPEFTTFNGQQFGDNYMASRKWYELANEKESKYGQDIMARILFRHYPYRSQIESAALRQREGLFDNQTQLAWMTAYDEWRNLYGKEFFQTPGGRIQLEIDEEGIEQLAREDGVDPRVKRHYVNQYQNLANYDYWRSRLEAERTDKMVQAHQQIFEGEKMYRQGLIAMTHFRPADDVCQEREERDDLSDEERRVLDVICEASAPMRREELAAAAEVDGDLLDEMEARPAGKKLLLSMAEAQITLEAGMRKFEDLIRKYPELTIDPNFEDEGLMAVLYWRKIHSLNEKPIPADYPLSTFWNERQKEVPSVERRFRIETRGGT